MKTFKSVARIFIICVLIYAVLKRFGYDPIQPILWGLEKFIEWVVRAGDWLASSSGFKNLFK